MLKFFRSKKGFTLVELMIVVAIIGILAGIAIPRYMNFIRRSREGATKGNLGAVRSALNIYYSDLEGLFPGTVDAAGTGLTAAANGFCGTTANHYMDAPFPLANESCGTHTESGSILGNIAMGVVPTNVGGWEYQTGRVAVLVSTSVARFFVNCTNTDTRKPTPVAINTW